MFEFTVLALLAAGLYLLRDLMLKDNGFGARLLVHKKKMSGRNNLLIWLVPWIFFILYIFMAYNQYVFFASAVSGSMSPAIGKGDVVLMQTLDKTPGVGDIVMFERQGALLMHRVYKVEGNAVITKGDANIAPDAPIGREKVLAEAVVIFGSPVILKNLGYSFDQRDWQAPASARIVAFTSVNFREHLLFLLGLAAVIYFLIIVIELRVLRRKIDRNEETGTPVLWR